MLGAIAGDIIGSVYEANPVKTTDFQLFNEFSRFTDDTVLTIATAHALIEGMDYAEAYRRFGRRYPGAGYGGAFINWLRINAAPPYNSWGNGTKCQKTASPGIYNHYRCLRYQIFRLTPQDIWSGGVIPAQLWIR